MGFSAVFGKVLSLILFLLMLLAALCLALHFSPKDAVRRAQERREAEWEDIPEEAPTVREKERPAEKRPRRRAAIDIPLDDEPPAKQPQPRPEEPAFAPKEKKPFFSRKSSTVRTPDQVLRGSLRRKPPPWPLPLPLLPHRQRLLPPPLWLSPVKRTSLPSRRRRCRTPPRR